MNDNSLKIAIVRNFISDNKLDEIDTVASEVILYEYLKSFVNINNERQNSIDNLVSAYADQYKTQYINTKNKYSCYNQIRDYISSIDKYNFLALTEAEISNIYDIYQHKVLLENFSIYTYSSKIYGLSNLSVKDNKRLNDIHDKFFVKLAKYLINKYGIKPTDIHIINASRIPDNPGKQISFNIDGISTLKVYTEIINSQLKNEIYKCELDYPDIIITSNS